MITICLLVKNNYEYSCSDTLIHCFSDFDNSLFIVIGNTPLDSSETSIYIYRSSALPCGNIPILYPQENEKSQPIPKTVLG